MDQEKLFIKALENLKETAELQGNVVTEEQIEEEFSDFELDRNRMSLIEDYLKQCKIGIGKPVNPNDYLSEEEKGYLDNYLRSLELLETVSDGRKRAISMAAMSGDREAEEQLIEVFLPHVVDIAKLYAGQGVYLEDLIGEGNVALSVGVQMLGCLEKPEEVDGMLGKMIMDAMEDCIETSVTSYDREKKLSDRVNKVADAAKELAEELGMDVTPEELAAEGKVSLKEIRSAIDLSADHIGFLKSSKEKQD